ncbi:MAG: hypothetical protein AMXMBFR84_32320 [Candidatus Hydrogenedentota bacterium]
MNAFTRCGVLAIAGLGWACAAAQTMTSLQQDASTVTVTQGGRILMRYRHGYVPYKPYVEVLCTPSGVNVIRDAPADHLHHHGLMFAITAGGVNFWEEAKAPGEQKHVSLEPIPDPALSGFMERIDWNTSKDGAALMHETRTLWTVNDDTLGAVILHWQTNLQPAKAMAAKGVELTGTNYHGLGLRFLASMDRTDGFFNANGDKGVAGTHEQRSPWCAFTGYAEGSPVTIALFDHPSNPRHPATWFTMHTAFSYMSVTLNLHKELLLLTESGIELKYGIGLWDGTQNLETVEKGYRRWLELAE